MTRAIAIVTGVPYSEVYESMASAHARHGYVRTANAYSTRKPKDGKRRRRSVDIQQDVMRDFGLVKVRLPAGPRPTWTEAHETYGNCIVRTTKHMAAIVDGKVRDTHDERIYHWLDENGAEIRQRKAVSVWTMAPNAVAPVELPTITFSRSPFGVVR